MKIENTLVNDVVGLIKKGGPVQIKADVVRFEIVMFMSGSCEIQGPVLGFNKCFRFFRRDKYSRFLLLTPAKGKNRNRSRRDYYNGCSR